MKLFSPHWRVALVLFCLAPGTYAQVVISEFMASNTKTLADSDGEYSDWIELHNTTNASVDLRGWFLTDSTDELTRWQFPSLTLPPDGYAVVFASGKNRAAAGAELHTNFSLDVQGEDLALVGPDGETIVSQFASFPAQAQDVSYGTLDDQTYYFTSPTPRAANSAGLAGLVADTKFSHDRGFYDAAFDLTITTATTGASIYYTTNGTSPSPANGFLYSTPVPISRTTVLRAAAFKQGSLPSGVDTQTYIFVDDVIHQAADGKAPPGWPASWGANTVDYGMDPDVVNDSRYSGTIKDDLKSIPSMSVVMDLKDLFDPTRGIYANPSQDGINWERPCSLELVNPDGTKGFQVNAGIRIRGGYSRSTGNPKHAFRFLFRKEYGDAKLTYPLFGEDGAEEFDGIDLRTFQNYSWSFEGDNRGIFMRDQFSRDAQLASGHQAERGKYYHLYINGLYWGLYNTDERPEASYGETYFGGSKEDYDVIKVAPDSGYTIYATDGNLEAWTRLWNAARAGLASDEAYQKIQGNNPDGTPNPEYEVLLDVDNLIDYMLVILYGGNLDAPISNFLGNSSPNNFFALRNRNSRQGFQFVAHDSEHTLLDVNQSRIGPYTAITTLSKSNPQSIWQQCWANAEFRMRVADHVHRHFFNGGIFTPEGARSLLLKRKAEIDRAVVAESARWGDSKRTTPRTRDVDWVAEVNRVVNTYMAQRTGIVLNQLRSKSLYPDVAAPSYGQHGGTISKGFALSMSAPAGAIYYTLNGSDPRLPGGGISPTAEMYRQPVSLNENVTVKARALSGDSWSALNEASFTVIQTFRELLVTEIMYNPPALNGVNGDEFEFLELKNVGSAELDLSGVRFTNGIDYVFPNGTRLPPGQFVVLVSNPSSFASKHPGVRVDGVYSGRLSDGGEALTLVHAIGTPLFSVAYDDALPWPLAADGDGFSIVPVNANANPNPNDPANWRASSRPGGSPGADDPPVNIQPVWVNEVLTHTDPPDIDQVELFNPGPAAADISYWYLSDDRATPKKFRFAAGTVIPSGGYLVLTEQQFNPNPGSPTDFRLDSHGEQIFLSSADAAGNLTGFSDGFNFGAAANGVTFGRYVTSAGEVHYPAQTRRTLGSANAGPLIGPLVFNELSYQPLVGEEEFIELKNITAAAVKLYDPQHPENTWSVDGIDFSFPPNSEIAPNGLALVVPSDPATFRVRHSVPASVPVFGPYPGGLQDGGEWLQLKRPDGPDVEANGTVIVPQIVVDAVRYSDKVPWPGAAAGLGASLERVNPLAYGDDPGNWRASASTPSPGFENDANRVPRVNAGPDQMAQASSFPFVVTVSAAASDDGQPNPPGALTFAWTQVSGPGPAVFATPGQRSTAVNLPGLGTYVLRFSASDGAVTASDDLVVVLERTPSAVTLLPAGSVWKYLDDGSDQGALWRTTDFDDSAWASGPAELGYGDTSDGRPEKTRIRFGTTSNRYITYYFRTTFNVSNPAAIRNLTARLLRDDGAIVYINGIEVFRSNMPGGAVTYTTPAASTVGNPDEATFFDSPVNASVLREGANVVAVEVHQINRSSTDVSFDFALTGLAQAENAAPVVNAGADISAHVNVPATLAGSVFDDGLPAPSQLIMTWSKAAGPGVVTFANASSAVTTAQFSAPGSYVLRLHASDGLLSAQDEVTVAVTGDAFSEWQARYFTAAELANAAVSGVSADPDGDGHNNQQEFNAGTDPMDPASVLKAAVLNWNGAPGVPLTVEFEAMPGKSYTVQCQDYAGAPWIKLGDVIPQAAAQKVQVKDFGASRFGIRFYRVVTPQQP